MNTLLSAACTFALLTGIAAVAAPDLFDRAGDALAQHAEAAVVAKCQARPAECLSRKQADLRALLGALDADIARIAVARIDAEREQAEVRASQASGRLYLNEARRLLTGASPAATQLSYIGTLYSYPQLRDQAHALFDEAAATDARAQVIDRTVAHLTDAQRDLSARRSDVLTAIKLQPAQLALIGARTLSAETDAVLARIDEALGEGRRARSRTDALMRSTQELTEDAARPAPAFESWLSGARP
jgi:hypothetical protein